MPVKQDPFYQAPTGYDWHHFRFIGGGYYRCLRSTSNSVLRIAGYYNNQQTVWSSTTQTAITINRIPGRQERVCLAVGFTP